MRGINFSIMDEKTRDEMFNNVYEQVKGSSYAKDFELKDIVIEKFEGMGGDYQLGIVIADCVMTDFKIVAVNSEDNGEISTELKIESGILPKGLLIPNEVNISTCWKEDSMNRYKVVKQNFEEMKEQGYLKDYYLFKWKGAKFDTINNSGDRVAGYTVTADSIDELINKHNTVRANIRVEDSNGTDIARHDLLTDLDRAEFQ